jgi:glutaredoxin 3
MAKEFLSDNKIHFEEKNISTDPQARLELQRRNISGVPAFIIGDDEVVGLDKEKILKLVDHRVIQCGKCSKKMRIPIKKGTLEVKCPKCAHVFKVQT